MEEVECKAEGSDIALSKLIGSTWARKLDVLPLIIG